MAITALGFYPAASIPVYTKASSGLHWLTFLPMHFLQWSEHRNVGVSPLVYQRSMLSVPGAQKPWTLQQSCHVGLHFADGCCSLDARLLYSRCQAAHRYKAFLLHSKRIWLFCLLHPNHKLSLEIESTGPHCREGLIKSFFSSHFVLLWTRKMFLQPVMVGQAGSSSVISLFFVEDEAYALIPLA